MSLYRTLAVTFGAAMLAGGPLLANPTGFAGGSILAAPIEFPGDIRLAQNERPRDQDRAFRATRDGRSMPLPMIERRVMPHMGGADYLGPEFKGETYRLKFMDQGHVIWVDVDASTGRIVRRSGN
ncbi:MAG TPA: hypothetical protein VNI79_05530 [Sphingomicrobium sp.]|nr:hypothetical protein [Sphingomicrobium sp.]